MIWFYTLSSIFLVSIASFAGAITLAVRQDFLKKILLFLVSFAAGALIGDVFIHLFPELSESGGVDLMSSLFIIGGIVLFFVLEKILHWRHCHMSALEDHMHPLAHINLIGDGVHNFIDGMVIAGSFLVSTTVGIATTIAVLLHEIPQEMGDFGILLHAGLAPKKALFYNFLSALTAILGGILILSLDLDVEAVQKYLIPFTIGGFLYIANADLIPELHKDVKLSNSFLQLLSLIAGVGVMALLLLME